MTLTFYDIPWSTPNQCWSFNLWKTRFILNYKGIPYKTEWVEYPDIEPLCKKLGIAPTTKADGSLWYTLPAIYDPSTDTYVSDSLRIAEYLEKTYPDTPSVFPHNTQGLQVAFTQAWAANLTAPFGFMLPVVYTKLNPASQGYFRRTRELWLGKKIEELTPTGDEAAARWAKFESELGKVDEWLVKSGGKYALGDTLSWADFLVGSYLIWFKVTWGEDSQRWKDVESWHGGRWKERLDSLKAYQHGA